MTRFPLALLIFLFAASGCRGSGPKVVVYSALDSAFAEPVLDDFERETGIDVQARFDVESTKTVGLTQAIINESQAGNPRCDVFWNNEILNTLRLQKRGMLEVYASPADEPFPPSFRSQQHTWHGFAARARVLIVNTDLVPPDDRPDSILDLANPKWKGRVGIAKPLFGTTATHAACLFAHWGDERAKEFFRSLKANEVSIESGNKQVAIRVATGQLAFGLTDTDDAIIELENGKPVEIIYPDSRPEQLGTLFIPNTLAIIKGSAHQEEAKKLIDYLLSPAVEKRLAEGDSAQIPLNPNVQAKVRVKTPADVKAMDVDFEKAVEKWDTTAAFLRNEFVR
jgi:iron(III) transport system substrate-binding protein